MSDIAKMHVLTQRERERERERQREVEGARLRMTIIYIYIYIYIYRVTTAESCINNIAVEEACDVVGVFDKQNV